LYGEGNDTGCKHTIAYIILTPFKNEAQWTSENYSTFIICEQGILNNLEYVTGGKILNYR
jgi:hypothetical protein